MPLLPELALELERRRRGRLRGEAYVNPARTRRGRRLRELEPRLAHAIPPLHPRRRETARQESAGTLAEYKDLCDIALFDLRYADDATARAASSAPGYVAASRAAVKWAWDNLGRLDCEEPGRATRGLIVRILVLPGHADEAIANLAWLASECSPTVHVSVMSQYTPAYKALGAPPFDRPVTEEEYESVAEAAADFGFENGWLQGFESRSADLDLLGESMPPGHGAVGCG